jgi:hypothetical protein
MTMRWTREKPTQPGWWWWRYEAGRKASVMHISEDHIHGMNVFTVGTLVLFLQEVPGEWAGPVPEPEEVT